LDQAIAICRRAIDRNPQDRLAPYHRLGLVLRAQGKPDEAIAVYRQAIEARPEESSRYLGDINETLREPKTVVAAPQDFDECMALATALVQQNKLGEAVTAYRQAAQLASNPNLAAGVYFQLGSALSRQQKRPDAIAAYLRAVDLDPTKHGAAAYIGLGLLLRDWGKPDEAAASLGKAIEINDPGQNTVVAHRLLGEILMKLNKLDEAALAFNKVIELKPDSPLSLRDLAWILANRPEVNLRDPQRAVELAKKAVHLDQRNRFYWQTLGYAEYRAGNWKSAIAALEQVKTLGSPGDSFEWFPLAMVHWQLGEKDKAREWYDKAVQWMEANAKDSAELIRFRAEAEELMKEE
jgi:tetratricopeptide (TPR) repeat protein